MNLKKKIDKNLEQRFLASAVGRSTKEKFLYHQIKNMEVTKCSQMTQALCTPFEGIVFEGIIRQFVQIRLPTPST